MAYQVVLLLSKALYRKLTHPQVACLQLIVTCLSHHPGTPGSLTLPYNVCSSEWPVRSATQQHRWACPPFPNLRLCPPKAR